MKKYNVSVFFFLGGVSVYPSVEAKSHKEAKEKVRQDRILRKDISSVKKIMTELCKS